MTDAIETHETAIIEAFAEVLKAEAQIGAAKTELSEHTVRLNHDIALADAALRKAWADIGDLMAETGEVEIVLPGSATDYKIGWSTPSLRVKVEPEAVPDEFCKIERRPKLKEIGDHLKKLLADGLPLPNWGSFESGDSKLGWKAVKHKHTTT